MGKGHVNIILKTRFTVQNIILYHIYYDNMYNIGIDTEKPGLSSCISSAVTSIYSGGTILSRSLIDNN